MDWSTRTLRALGAAAGLAVAGCYSSSPYGSGYPVYSAPVGAPMPGGTYIAPGPTLAPGAPGTFTQPYTTQSGSSQPGSGIEWRPTPQQFPTPVDPQSDAPAYSPGTSSGSSGSGTFVPNYGDPNADGFNTTPFDSSSTTPASNGAPYVELKGIDDTASVASAPVAAAPFEDDLSVRPTAQRRALSETMAVKVQADPNPYAYDRAQYSWLRGKVDFDPVDRSWNIIYSLVPEESDLYQGSMTLAESPLLEKLHNDDVVVVEGRPDPNLLDLRGKPCYRVDSVFGPLKPQG